ncbi:MAG: type II toxin-antitoxin system RelE/ParE family toxin [Bacteroidota bacterium]
MEISKITWDKQAVVYLRKYINYIRKDSPQNAEKVKMEVLRKISELLKRPEIHNPDKYKLNNSGDYRAFEVYRLRIAYLVKKDEIIIARIRSTDQEPVSY